eukprot:11821-Pyramimonas_sp.AAC.1
MRLLLRTAGLKACLTEEETIATTRLLTERIGSAIANSSNPPGDAGEALRAGQPEQMPHGTPGK